MVTNLGTNRTLRELTSFMRRTPLTTIPTRWTKKVRPQIRGHNFVNPQPMYQFFFSGRFFVKFAVNWLLKLIKIALQPLLKILPHFAYVATLRCEILMSENKRLTLNYNYKLLTHLKGGSITVSCCIVIDISKARQHR